MSLKNKNMVNKHLGFIFFFLFFHTAFLIAQDSIIQEKSFVFNGIENLNNILFNDISGEAIRITSEIIEYDNEINGIKTGLKGAHYEYYLVFEDGVRIKIGASEEPRYLWNNFLYSVKSNSIDEYSGSSILKIYKLSKHSIELIASKDFVGVPPLIFFKPAYSSNILVSEFYNERFVLNIYSKELKKLRTIEIFKDGFKNVVFSEFKNEIAVVANSVLPNEKVKLVLLKKDNLEIIDQKDVLDNDRIIKNIFFSDKYFLFYADNKIVISNREGKIIFEDFIWLPFIDEAELVIDDSSNMVFTFIKDRKLIGIDLKEKRIKWTKTLADIYPYPNLKTVSPVFIKKIDENKFALLISNWNSPTGTRYKTNFENNCVIQIDRDGNVLKINKLSDPTPYIKLLKSQQNNKDAKIISDEGIFNLSK